MLLQETKSFILSAYFLLESNISSFLSIRSRDLSTKESIYIFLAYNPKYKMDTLLKNRILYALSNHSLAVPEINAIHGFLHNYYHCLIRITEILEDIIHLNVIQITDIPNIVLLIATVFQETVIRSREYTDPEILFLLIKITASCILDTNPKTSIYSICIPENTDAIVIESMINTCLELLRMMPMTEPHGLDSFFLTKQKRKCCYSDWFF